MRRPRFHQFPISPRERRTNTCRPRVAAYGVSTLRKGPHRESYFRAILREKGLSQTINVIGISYARSNRITVVAAPAIISLGGGGPPAGAERPPRMDIMEIIWWSRPENRDSRHIVTLARTVSRGRLRSPET